MGGWQEPLKELKEVKQRRMQWNRGMDLHVRGDTILLPAFRDLAIPEFVEGDVHVPLEHHDYPEPFAEWNRLYPSERSGIERE